MIKNNERSKKLYNSNFVSEHVNMSNQEKWVKAIEYLGDKWILAKPIKKQRLIDFG
jgi:hypothetical protein